MQRHWEVALRSGGLTRRGGAIHTSCGVGVPKSRRADINGESAGLGSESCMGWVGRIGCVGQDEYFRREGGRQVDMGTYDADKLERLRLTGVALQRQMRRRVEEHELQSIHTRAPASELYWAVVALLIDDGTVNANVRVASGGARQTNARTRRQGQANGLRPVLGSETSSWLAVGQQHDATRPPEADARKV